jgi:hypothetical protein
MGWLTAATLRGHARHWWAFKHNGTHHLYTSIAGFDDDLDIGKLVRVAREQPWKPWHASSTSGAVALLIYPNMIRRRCGSSSSAASVRAGWATHDPSGGVAALPQARRRDGGRRDRLDPTVTSAIAVTLSPRSSPGP